MLREAILLQLLLIKERRKIMKKNILKRTFGLFGIFALTVLLFACLSETNIKDDQCLIQNQQEKVMVSFSVTNNMIRTVLPQVSLENVASYKLFGGIVGETETELLEFTKEQTTVSVELVPGTWNFTLNAYNSDDEHILQSKILNRQVSLTDTNQISFSLSVISEGMGTIQITLNFPVGAGITRISTSGDIGTDNFTSISGGSFVYNKNNIATGDYFINFQLFQGNVLRTVVSELVLVRNNLTSSKIITLVGNDLKPILTGTVSIIGNILVGETLSVNTSSLNGAGDISYQWKRNGTDISGAANASYIITAADVGNAITVTVTRIGYVSDVTSSPTVAVPALVERTFNSVTGDGSTTQTTTVLTLTFNQAITGLTADDITLSGIEDIQKGVLGGTGPTYTLPISGFTSSGTLNVAVVKSGFAVSPIEPRTVTVNFAGRVSITGTVLVGNVLTADTSLLGGSGVITYQWLRNGTNISGATGSTYTVQFADAGTVITVRATRSEENTISVPTIVVPTPTVIINGTAQVGNTLTANITNLGGTLSFQWRRGTTNIGTNSTYVVQSGDVGSTITVTVTRADITGNIISNATAAIPEPTAIINGTAQVGNTLTANISNIGSPTYQWRRGTTNITGATGSTYLVQFADVGSAINVVVRGVTSVATTAIPQPTVTVTGNAIVGQAITATVNNLGGTLTYQWTRDGVNISGATGITYVVQAADAGLPIRVVVTRTGITGSITSPPVAAILQLAFSTTVQGSITASSPAIRYQVVLLQPGTLVLSITSPGGSAALPNNAADVQWFNASGTRIDGTTGGFIFPYNEDRPLAAGTYFIEVTGRGGIGQTGIYNIRLDYFTTESANNTTIANAQVLVSGLTVRAEITTTKERGIFRYNLTEPGRLTINVVRDTLPNGGANIHWLDVDGNIIRRGRDNDWGVSFPYNAHMDLEAGTYYISIIRYNNNTGTYTLRGDFVAAGNNEIEPNNTLATAQLLTSGQTVRGFLSHQDDRDIFRYNLTVPGRLAVNIARDTLPNGGANIHWLDASGNIIRRGRDNDWGVSFPYNDHMDLEAGTYYVSILRYNNNTGTYTLRGDFVAAGNNTIKPNNTRPTAQLLSSGQTVIGFISYQEERDMYRVVLTQARRLTVNVTLGTLPNGGANIHWLDVDGNIIRRGRQNDWGVSFPYNDHMDLAAGTYYISVFRYNNTGTYNLTVQW
jgi:hypothetical protein